GLLLRVVGACARRVRRARDVDEVRAARRPAALVRLPRRAPLPAAHRIRRGVRRRHRGGFLPALLRAVAMARDRDVLPPHVRLPVRTVVAVLPLGLAAVPRQRDPQPPRRPAGARGAARRRCSRALLVAAAPLGAAARRLRARADALVLPLPAVVLPVRRDRAVGVLGAAAASAVFVGSWTLLHHWF